MDSTEVFFFFNQQMLIVSLLVFSMQEGLNPRSKYNGMFGLALDKEDSCQSRSKRL